MNDFEVLRPRSLEECLDMLATCGEGGAPIAGGTDLHLLMQEGLRTPSPLIHIGRLGELRGCLEAEGRIHLGPALTHSEVAAAAVTEGIACLRAAAGSVGSPQIRNVGTVGGNLANASPAADTYPALMVLEAELKIAGPDGGRSVAIESFPRGPGLTVLRPGEMISDITFKPPEDRAVTSFHKVGLRNALAVSVASLAVYFTMDGRKVGSVRLAGGAVAPRPIRLRQTEELLLGEEPSPDLAAEAGRTAAGECEPVTDLRADVDYRRQVMGGLVRGAVRGLTVRMEGERN
jgi:CO/xanthine dehydrogenase FAD-binding subunit